MQFQIQERMPQQTQESHPVADTPINSGEEQRYAQPESKISRNAPCPCGSGKKYKHCCGAIKM